MTDDPAEGYEDESVPDHRQLVMAAFRRELSKNASFRTADGSAPEFESP